jgi:hypothetical protein
VEEMSRIKLVAEQFYRKLLGANGFVFDALKMERVSYLIQRQFYEEVIEGMGKPLFFFFFFLFFFFNSKQERGKRERWASQLRLRRFNGYFGKNKLNNILPNSKIRKI